MARIFGLDLTQIIPLLFLVLVISRDCLLLPFFYFVHLEQIWYVRNQRKKQAPKETSTSSITTRSMLNQLQWRPRPENAQWSFMLVDLVMMWLRIIVSTQLLRLKVYCLFLEQKVLDLWMDGDPTNIVHDGQKFENKSTSITEVHKLVDISGGPGMLEVPRLASPVLEPDSSIGRMQNIDTPATLTSSVDGNESIFEEEECILELGTSSCEEKEPMYEGEAIIF